MSPADRLRAHAASVGWEDISAERHDPAVPGTQLCYEAPGSPGYVRIHYYVQLGLYHVGMDDPDGPDGEYLALYDGNDETDAMHRALMFLTPTARQGDRP